MKPEDRITKLQFLHAMAVLSKNYGYSWQEAFEMLRLVNGYTVRQFTENPSQTANLMAGIVYLVYNQPAEAKPYAPPELRHSDESIDPG